MDYIDIVQWPAMVITVVAAWYIGSQRAKRRMLAFWCFMLSNVLWVIWGLHAEAYALIVLELTLCAMNLRGLKKNLAGASVDASR
ncbi:hypothetical protein J3P77_11105 [Pseudomonas sp. R1-18]|uniref:hypothetical protein n=1 Tax=Pseudomonas sp. R1-18 TaxID=1632772 RepID=UPI003DAA18B6